MLMHMWRAPFPFAPCMLQNKTIRQGGAGPACTKAAAGGGPAYQLSSPVTTVAPARQLHSGSYVAGPYGPAPPSYKQGLINRPVRSNRRGPIPVYRIGLAGNR